MGLISTGSPRQTPFHDRHVEAGARMVEFAGWHLPIQFVGLIDEHLAVRERAGLFDVSHMGEAAVRGPQALEFLQWVTCNDVSRLVPGRVQYTAMTTPEGTVVDDLLIYRLAEQEFLLVINAANTPKDLAWLAEHASRFDAVVEDQSDRWAQLALQGPHAERVLQPFVERPLDTLRPFWFYRVDVDSVPSIVSRTGYTGEDGFEIYASADSAEGLWSTLLDSGSEHGLSPIGLGARDTLRLEACLALYGNDIDETTTVVEAALGWIVKPKKGDFLGREILVRQLEQGAPRKLVGFEMRGRRIARAGCEARQAGRAVGRVTSGTHSPTLRKNIGLVYLPTEMARPGVEFDVDIRGRDEPAVVVPTPFYKRPR